LGTHHGRELIELHGLSGIETLVREPGERKMTREGVRAPAFLRGKDAVASGSRSRFLAGRVEVALFLPEHGIKDHQLGRRRVAAKDRVPPRTVECPDDPTAGHPDYPRQAYRRCLAGAEQRADKILKRACSRRGCEPFPASPSFQRQGPRSVGGLTCITK